MDPITIGLGVASIASSVFGGMSANSKAKGAARAQAKLTFFERQEQIRQMKASADAEKGLAKASVYASNLQMTGTSRDYVTSLNMANVREAAMAERAAYMEMRAIKKGAQGAGNAMFAQAAGQALGMAAGALFKPPATSDFGSPYTSGAANSSSTGPSNFSYSSTPGGVEA